MDVNQDWGHLMKEAQKMQKRMLEAQEQLSKLIVVGESGGGMVKIKMNGRHDLLDVKINESLFNDGDVDMIQDLVKAAGNDAVQKVESESKRKITEITAGMEIPKDLLKDKEEG